MSAEPVQPGAGPGSRSVVTPGGNATAEQPAVSLHAAHHRPDANPTGGKLAVLTLTALGVVYGDIGTSPLYSVKECFRSEFGLAPTVGNVYGVLSLIVWSLVLVVSV